VIVVDPLVSQETAAAGIELYRRHRGDRPVTAVVYQTGDFRWAATLLDHAVFADQTHQGARLLYANTLEQLGYGAENGIWRNFFLSGATELRDGNFGTPVSGAAPLIVAQLTPEQLFDAIAITVNGPQAWTWTSPSTSLSPTSTAASISPCATVSSTTSSVRPTPVPLFTSPCRSPACSAWSAATSPQMAWTCRAISGFCSSCSPSSNPATRPSTSSPPEIKERMGVGAPDYGATGAR
jgi:hypothetical protein